MGRDVFTKEQEVCDEGSGFDNAAPRFDVDVCFGETDAQDGPAAVDGDEAQDAHDSEMCVSITIRWEIRQRAYFSCSRGRLRCVAWLKRWMKMMSVAKAAQAPPSMRSNSKKVYVPKMGDWASTQLVAVLR